MTTTSIQLSPTQLPTAPQPVTQEQANAWVGLAQQKNQLVFDLSKKELAAQSILLPLAQDATYETIDAALAAYRKAHTDMVEYRKPFTNAVSTGIIEPLMAFEKRVDPKNNQAYLTLVQRSLALRKVEADKAALVNAKNQEIASFKSHVFNEFSRVVTEWRATIRRGFSHQYQIMLKEGTPNPPVKEIKDMMSQIAPPAINRFEAKYLTREEMFEIYEGAQKPDYTQYLKDLYKEVDDLFANYSSDLANAEAAIKHQEDAAKLKELEEASKAKEEQAMSTLITTAETVVIDEPKIKKTVQVTVIESEQWAKAVMAAFIVNLPKLGKYIRVKSWSKLSIGQMATYLGQYATESGVTFTGLELKEVEK